MKKSRPFLLLVTILMAISTIACSTAGSGRPTETSENLQAESKGNYVANVPKETFDGETFTVGGIDPALYESIIIDFDFEESPSDSVQDAIYKRNRLIEAQFDIEFINEYIGNHMVVLDLFKQTVLSQSDDYQLIMLISRHAFAQAVEGDALRSDQIPYMDMTQPWYIKSVNDTMNISGVNVLTYTDECLNAYLQSICVFFNMNMLSDLNLDNPYGFVNNGTWTLETFYQMANAAKSDVNSDGIYSPIDGDVYGIVAENDSFYPSMWIGADTMSITKNRENIPSFSAFNDKKLIGILENLDRQLANDGFFCNSFTELTYVQGDGDVVRNEGTAYFAEGGSLFRVGCVGYIQLLREMDANFGVLPLPKYDESQTEYYSRACDGWIHVAPTTVQNLELLGTVIESLGAESKNFVIPAFFDIALESKFVRDEDRENTEKMLDMIFANAKMDLGDSIWHEIVGNVIISQVSTGQGGYASALASQYNSVSAKIEETVNQIKELK